MMDAFTKPSGSTEIAAISKGIEALRELAAKGQYRDFWAQARQIGDAIRDLDPLMQQYRESLGADFSSLCDRTRAEQEARREEAKANVGKVQQEIESLRIEHREAGEDGASAKVVYKDFWAHAKHIAELFRTLRLFRDDRERLWQAFQAACEEVRTIQKEEQEAAARQRERIEALVAEAKQGVEDAGDREALERARATLNEAMSLIRDTAMARQDRDQVWTAWREVNEAINRKQASFQQATREEVAAAIEKAKQIATGGDPYEALRTIKETQVRVREAYFLTKVERDEIRTTLNAAWEQAVARVEKQRQERQRRQEEWKARTAEHIVRWESNIQKSQPFVSRLEREVAALKAELADARTEGFIQMMGHRLAEKQAELDRELAQVNDWKARVADARQRLGDDSLIEKAAEARAREYEARRSASNEDTE